jgi:hypothetical protein
MTGVGPDIEVIRNRLLDRALVGITRYDFKPVSSFLISAAAG